MKIKKTVQNPHGLTAKRQMVVEAVIDGIDEGNGMNLPEKVEKIYEVKNTQNARNIANQLLKNADFREALVGGLKERKILGADSRVEQGLDDGLGASIKRPHIIDRDEKGRPIYEYVREADYATRLRYIQEINKIAGVYAPEKKETRKLSLNIDMTKEELDLKLKTLKEELKGT